MWENVKTLCEKGNLHENIKLWFIKHRLCIQRRPFCPERRDYLIQPDEYFQRRKRFKPVCCLGAKVFHAGRIGKDGEFLVEQLKEAGVNTDLVVVDEDCSTGHAIIQNDAEGDNCILLYGGANQRITKEQIDAALEQFDAGDYLVLQNEISNLPYLMEKAAEKQMKIVLNPSPMDEKIKALPLDKVTLFFVNEIEAAQILGQKELESTEKAVGAFRAMFPQAAVVLTLGFQGSVYIDKDQVIPQKCYKVKAVDTTAAGDTFTGFFVSAISKGKSPKEALDLASRASAIAVSRPGAAPSVPTLDEVENWEFAE